MIRIGVVDDEPTFRSLLWTVLEQDPLIQVVATAANGMEAIQLYEALAPDVLITNVMMPLLSGVEVAEVILGRHPGAKVIILTAYSGADARERAMRAGVASYILKPPTRMELLASVHDVAGE